MSLPVIYSLGKWKTLERINRSLTYSPKPPQGTNGATIDHFKQTNKKWDIWEWKGKRGSERAKEKVYPSTRQWNCCGSWVSLLMGDFSVIKETMKKKNLDHTVVIKNTYLENRCIRHMREALRKTQQDLGVGWWRVGQMSVREQF